MQRSYLFWLRLAFVVAYVLNPRMACGQNDFQKPPIAYDQTAATDPVAQLIKQLKSGQTSLGYDPTHGWLPSLLERLSVPISSQTLVFSKTSLQIEHISPSNPRAIYFNDNVYVGAIPGGQRIEISAVDPQLGAVFYAMDAYRKTTSSKDAKVPQDLNTLPPPVIVRDKSECMRCHNTGKTQNVPGFLVRSVYPKRSGHPRYELGTTTTDHTTPLLDRFGGWYVTGFHGNLRHRGNAFALDDSKTNRDAPFDFESGANQKSLPKRVDPKKYLHDKSDIVALMVLEHQSQVHNAITRAGHETRMAYHYQSVLNRALDRPAEFVSESTVRRMKKVGDNLLEHLLFANEAKLDDHITGSKGFAAAFQADARRDSKGRSLRDFDLKTRMFRYPCSYLIGNEAYEAMPTQVRDYVEQRLVTILTLDNTETPFQHLTPNIRENLFDILCDLMPRLARVNRSQ